MNDITPTPPLAEPVTTDVAGVPTSKPQPKVIAGAVGSGVGVAVAAIAVYIVETAANFDIPPTIEAAVSVVVVAAFSFTAGYIKRPSPAAS